nr:hypothetical protein [Clostridium lundense]
MYIENPKSNDIAYTIDFNCDWDSEHGMSRIIRNGEILYVGEGMVHFYLKAWENLDSYKNDVGNFVFNGKFV